MFHLQTPKKIKSLQMLVQVPSAPLLLGPSRKSQVWWSLRNPEKPIWSFGFWKKNQKIPNDLWWELFGGRAGCPKFNHASIFCFFLGRISSWWVQAFQDRFYSGKLWQPQLQWWCSKGVPPLRMPWSFRFSYHSKLPRFKYVAFGGRRATTIGRDVKYWSMAQKWRKLVILG